MLVANAGITADTLVLRMTEDDWSSVIDTNLTGSFRVAKRAAKGMLRLRRGRIVFISSVVGLLGSAGPGQLRRLQGRPGRHGPVAGPRARVAARSPPTWWRPGFVETDMTAVLTDEQKAAIKAQVPLGRYASAGGGRLGGAAGWPPTARPTSPGRSIPVDGGLGMGH